jgi:hypothetical protein
MSVDAPVAGERITYDWGVDVSTSIANLEARTSPDLLRRMSADESTNTATISSLTGLTIDSMIAGRTARITGQINYSCANTNQGLGIGFRHPGGNANGIFRIFGVTSGNVEAIERLSTLSASTDEMTTAATVSTGGGYFICEFTIFYHATASGTFTMRKRLNGTPGSTGLTIYQGSGFTALLVD